MDSKFKKECVSMKNFSIEHILKQMADMQAFANPKDELSMLLLEYENQELDLEELELVSAAGSVNYQEFLNKIRKQ